MTHSLCSTDAQSITRMGTLSQVMKRSSFWVSFCAFLYGG